MGAGGVHGGHRERMRSKYVRGGLEVLADHEVLELLIAKRTVETILNIDRQKEQEKEQEKEEKKNS